MHAVNQFVSYILQLHVQKNLEINSSKLFDEFTRKDGYFSGSIAVYFVFVYNLGVLRENFF